MSQKWRRPTRKRFLASAIGGLAAVFIKATARREREAARRADGHHDRFREIDRDPFDSTGHAVGLVGQKPIPPESRRY
ncbi:MAG TPA: hypothetical protein VKM54_19875 [Myxococcota bacterium]|nr:hypothetical protein [Myxococcota bacterium]